MKSPFRSIRQTLFNEGKLLRYIGYAFGEIALIIVGILFALKINNWNEDRKAQVEFDTYIVQLKEDVTMAMQHLDREVEEAEIKLERGVFLLKKLNGEAIKADEILNFENYLDSLGRIEPVDLNIGYLKDLLDGNMDRMVHDRNLTLTTMKTIRVIDRKLTQAMDKVRIIQVVDETIMKYRGRKIYGIPDLHMSYDLNQLRSSPEFIYALENATEAVQYFGRMLSSSRQTLESFLTVLEEYE